jgi:DUF4097 and DUF4098 domain-containing protein YvlB
MRLVPVLSLFVLIASAGGASAVVVNDRAQHEVSLAPNGVLVIENPHGNIDITGGDEAKLVMVSDRTIRAVNDAAVGEARQAVQRVLEGNEQTRVIRTVMPQGSNSRWSAQVHYTVTVPRMATVKISSTATGRIRVMGIGGPILVKNMIGPVVVENPGGRVEVENINGNIVLVALRGVAGNARLSSVNGSVIVRTPANSGFFWESETVMGDARTGFDVRRGRYLSPTRFRSPINSPGNVTIVTETFGGNVLMMPLGAPDDDAQPIRELVKARVMPDRTGVGPMLPDKPRHVRLPLVQGFYRYETSMGDVRIDEIRGATRIVTGAGEVNLGTVFGHCEVLSNGGPVTLGEIIGPLNARTEAGNISVQRARAGGSIFTGGGTIQLQYAGGPMQMSSGGGDIIVRQANGPVTAETKSGDISITLDGSRRSERIVARTAKGNVALIVPAGFAADIEAVLLTSDPAADSIRIDFPGLSVQREQVGGRTRIRATGKMNGGGERVELAATDGGIQIMTDAPRVSPMVPRQ